MQDPKVRIWIDARKEKIRAGEINELKYEILNLHDQELLRLIYQTIGLYVLSLAVDDDKLLVTYQTDKISPSFIDYLLQQRGIEFKRHN